MLAIGAALTLVPVAVPSSAHAAAGAAAPSATAASSAADCLRVDPADTRSPDQLRGKNSRRSGRAAVAALGSRLARAAALNHQSAASLTSILEGDTTARLDGCSKLLYVETAPAAGDVAAADPVTDPAPGSVSLAQALSLNSRPSSTRTIYLDFLGGSYSGSFVCQYAGVTPCTLPAFTQDSDATTFSATELLAIYRIWQSVAEDYAPFDVNVSTQDLGSAALDRASSGDPTYGTRVVVTSDTTWAAASTATPAGCGCGGMAYVGSWPGTGATYAWDAYEDPVAVIVTANLGNGGTKYVAEATSHEVGHNFGLNHDGTIAHGSTTAVGYYQGQGNWAPIMGASYYKPVTQWSKGEYTYANNTQDDTAIIAAGAPLLTDDVGNTAGAATALTSGTPFSGLLTSPADSDWFSFTSLGVTQLAVTPAATNPDLDVSLEVRASNGTTVLETWNPAVSGSQPSSLASTVAGLEAHRTTTALPAGTYYARVTGTGEGDPLVTGYSSYDSVGRYTISMTTTTGALTVASTTTTPAVTGTPYSWTATTSGGVGNAVTWAVTTGTLPTGLSLASDGTVSGTPTTAGSKTVTLTATEATTLATASASVTFTVYAPVSVSSGTLPAGVLGSAYSTKLTSTGSPSTTWSVWSGSAPSGLTLATDGTLSGTPTTAGTFLFQVKATDPVSSTSATSPVSLTVAPALAVTTVVLPEATTGVAVSDTISATGGTGTATWAVTSGSLPPGLSLVPGSNAVTVTGTPTTTGTYPFTLKATNAATVASAGGTASASFSIRVADPLVLSGSTVPAGVIGVPFSASLSSSGGLGPMSYAVDSGTLPAGLTLSSDGVISGTVSAASSASVHVTVTDARSTTASAWVDLWFVAQLQIVSYNLGPMIVGATPTATFYSTGGTGGAIHWSVTKGALPPGLTLTGENTWSPTITGTATTAGSYDRTIAVDNTGNVPHAQQDVTLVVVPPLAGATCALAPAMVGVAYSATVPFIGGIAPISTYASTSPPDGLSLSTDGRLTGTPLRAGSATFSVDAFDAATENASESCSITVLPRLLVSTAAVAQPTLGISYAAWLSATGGGTSPRTWTKSSGTLPSGITLSSTGRLSGTPKVTGTFNATVRVTTADGFTATRTLTIIVAKKLVITSPSVLAVAHRNKTYSVRLVASGGYGTRTWTKVSGSLPPGLKLSSAGVVYGKATRTGTYVMTVRARDRAGRVTARRITIVVRL